METVFILILFLAPGVVAALRHHAYSPLKTRGEKLCAWLIYSFVIVWFICLLKMLGARGSEPLVEAFSSVKSLVIFGAIAVVAALLLPLVYVRFAAPFLRKVVERSRHTVGATPAGQKTGAVRASVGGSVGGFTDKTSIKRLVVALVVVFVFGCVSIVLASMIPDDRIDSNIKASSAIMSKEGKYPEWIPGVIYYRIDNWTEAGFLNMLYNGDDAEPIDSAFAQREFWNEEGDKSGVGRLAEAVKDEPKGHFVVRSAYWLGMRIIVLPLLLIANYYQIRGVMVFVNLLLIIFTVVFLYRRVDMKTSISFATALLLLNYFVSVLQLCNGASMLWIVYGTLLCMMGFRKKRDCMALFVAVGALTSFFDWFSVPLITFGLPVSVAISRMMNEEPGKKFKEYFKLLLKSGIGWCIGYGGMMTGRAVLCALIVEDASGKGNFLARVIYNITSTGGGSSGSSERFSTIVNGFTGVFPFSLLGVSWGKYALIAGLILTAAIAVILFKKIPGIAALWLVSLCPIVWFTVFNGYCRVHYWIAFRVYVIMIFDWLLIIWTLIDYRRKKVSAEQGGPTESEVVSL